jgi:hypothetical protein
MLSVIFFKLHTLPASNSARLPPFFNFFFFNLDLTFYSHSRSVFICYLSKEAKQNIREYFRSINITADTKHRLTVFINYLSEIETVNEISL